MPVVTRGHSIMVASNTKMAQWLHGPGWLKSSSGRALSKMTRRSKTKRRDGSRAHAESDDSADEGGSAGEEDSHGTHGNEEKTDTLAQASKHSPIDTM